MMIRIYSRASAITKIEPAEHRSPRLLSPPETETLNPAGTWKLHKLVSEIIGMRFRSDC